MIELSAATLRGIPVEGAVGDRDSPENRPASFSGLEDETAMHVTGGSLTANSAGLGRLIHRLSVQHASAVLTYLDLIRLRPGNTAEFRKTMNSLEGDTNPTAWITAWGISEDCRGNSLLFALFREDVHYSDRPRPQGVCPLSHRYDSRRRSYLLYILFAAPVAVFCPIQNLCASRTTARDTQRGKALQST